jgi:MFS family permease
MAATDVPAADRSSSAWASLHDRNYRLFWLGGFVSNVGRWFQAVAVPAVIWQLTESAAWVGFTGFATMAPMAFVSPVAGALADRFERRRLLLVTQSLQAVATGLLLATWLVGVRNPALFAGLSALAGACSGLNLPGWKAFTSDLVPRERLLNAITLNSVQFNASRTFGPALAGVTLAALGPAWAFAINFVSFGAVLGALLLIDVTSEPTGAAAPFAPLRDFVETTRWINTQPGIKQALLSMGAVGLLGLPVQVLAVVFAEEVFDGGERAYGLMLAMMGLGAVLAGPFVAGRGAQVARSRLLSIGMVFYAVGLTAFAFAPSLVVAFGAMFLIGSAHLTTTSTLNTVVQAQAAGSRLAKVLSVHMLVVTLSSPVGQLVLGQVMSRLAPRTTIALAAALLATIAVLFIALGRLKPLDRDEPTPAE